MALIEQDVPFESVRPFRDNEGKAHAFFLVADVRAVGAAANEEESPFSGQSYAHIEIHVDNGRLADQLAAGAKLHVLLDIVPVGGE